jgi:predicted transcriptional regulator
MPPRKSNTLTEAELRLMKLLWVRGESAVSDLVAAMPDGEALAYTSVLTTVRILEQKGYVKHRQEGRAFLYSPCVAEREASRSEIRHTMQRFFGNSRERLLLSLLGDDEIDPEELSRLKALIAKAEGTSPTQGDQAAVSRAPGKPAQKFAAKETE